MHPYQTKDVHPIPITGKCGNIS